MRFNYIGTLFQNVTTKQKQRSFVLFFNLGNQPWSNYVSVTRVIMNNFTKFEMGALCWSQAWLEMPEALAWAPFTWSPHRHFFTKPMLWLELVILMINSNNKLSRNIDEHNLLLSSLGGPHSEVTSRKREQANSQT